jgi:hypothetical protein
MSFTNTINPDGSITTTDGTNYINNNGNGSYSTTRSLTNTTVNVGGIDISCNNTVNSFTNNYIIFGGGGRPVFGEDGKNALQIESGKTITSLINLGSFCGGGGGAGGGGAGGAGGGGGGGGAAAAAGV